VDADEHAAELSVERGLYTLTYRWEPIFGLPGAMPPIATVAPGPGSENDIRVVSAPGDEPGILDAPGKGLVVVAERDGLLALTMRAAAPGGTVTANLDLRKVEAARPVLAPATDAKREELPAGIAEFLVCAHVSMRGDVAAYRGDWLCGPKAPGRIEGMEVRATGGDLPLEYQVATNGRGLVWSNWMGVGAYAGTKGRALPLVGVRVRLKESSAAGLVLKAEALFLGSSVISRTGRDVELIGPSPLDPLVGLRLDIARSENVMADHRVDPDPVRPAGRLRVFRGTRSRASEND